MNKKINLKPLVAAIMLSTTTAHAELQTLYAAQPNPVQIKQAINSYDLILAAGIFDPKEQSLDFQHSGITNSASQHYGIVQFTAGNSDATWLKKHGFQVMQSFSNHAYLVNWQQADQGLLALNADIRWYGPFLSGYKVSPKLWLNNRTALSSYTLSVKAFKDYPTTQLKNLIKKAVPNAMFVPTNIVANSGEIGIEVPANQLNQALNKLSSFEAIQWINHYYPEKFMNTEAVSAVQAASDSGGSGNTYRPNTTPLFDQGIYGSGQIVAVADSGLDRNEGWFVNYNDGSGINTAITNAENVVPPLTGALYPNNKVIAYWTMPGATAYDNGTYHGTHTSGSVAGDREDCIGTCDSPMPSTSSPSNSGYDNDDGMAPNAQILFQDLGSNSGLTGSGSSPMWQQAYAAGAKIHSNSYGAVTLGEYVSSDQNLDNSLRSLDDMIIIFAAGNDNGFTNTTSSPGNSKSGLTVGALNHGNSDTVASYSNGGPTDDGRLKPDISATGTSIGSAAGDANNSAVIDTPARRHTSGTSMATPITAGATALLRQYFMDGFYPNGVKTSNDSITPSGQLMKAMLLNGTNTGPGFFSNRAGWGKVWLENTLYFTGDERKFKFWDITHESGLSTSEGLTFDVDVLAGQEFRATLVWYDVAGPTGSGITLVNNLDLTVTTPVDTYLGNHFSAAVSTTGGTADAINTVEQVRFISPVSGNYQITVSAPNVPGDGSLESQKQGFALVVSGDLGSDNPMVIGNPTDLNAADLGATGVGLNWEIASNATYYEVYRSNGTCADMEPGSLRYIGQNNSNTFVDADTTGGYNYAYQVRAFNSDFESSFSNCTDIVSNQACLLPPQFSAAESSVVNNIGASCTIDLAWPAASSNCPNNTQISYNIYRSSEHNFVPGSENLLTTVNDASQFSDISATAEQVYFYRIEAVNNGNASETSPELASSTLGTPSSAIGNISDDVDNDLLMNLSGTWSVSNDRASNGTLSYRSTYEGASTYTSNTCSRLLSPALSIPNAGTPSVDYQAWYQLEANWDGVVVEISTDGGDSWNDLPPVGGYPSDFSSTLNPPINGCGYPASQGAFGGASTGFDSFTHDLSAYLGETVQIRWSFSSDPGYEEEGFYLDQVNYNGVNTFNLCVADLDLIFKDGFEN